MYGLITMNEMEADAPDDEYLSLSSHGGLTSQSEEGSVFSMCDGHNVSPIRSLSFADTVTATLCGSEMHSHAIIKRLSY